MLSNRDIRRRMEAGEIVIDPPPPDTAFGGASVDLTLSANIRILNPSRIPYIDFARLHDEPDYLMAITDHLDLGNGDPLVLHPGRVVICSTVERLRVPLDLCAELHGRSSLARLGVLPHTAGKVDPGWDGTLTLEVSNLGEIPVALYPGEAVCQVVFHELSSPADLTPTAISRYHGQSGPTMARPRPAIPPGM